VIKVESPDGDVTRQIGRCGIPAWAPIFLNTNRSKRCVCIDLKKEEGRAALLAWSVDRRCAGLQCPPGGDGAAQSRL
jgi:hypothetical protein